MKAIQLFSQEYLETCSRLTTKQILGFLEEFRLMHTHGKKIKTKLISIKIEEDVLEAFRRKADAQGLKYQTQIKVLMKNWVK